MRVLVIVLALTLLISAGFVGERPCAAEALEPALQKRVDAAVQRGLAYLLKTRAKDGTWSGKEHGISERARWTKGEQALCLLTLLYCGKDKQDPIVRRGYEIFREAYIPHAYRTYHQTMGVLLEQALGNKAQLPVYLDWFRKTHRERVWRYGADTRPEHHPEDLSCTQFALLALHALDANGLTIEASYLRKVMSYVLEHQETTGPVVKLRRLNRHWHPASTRPKFVPRGRERARGWGYLPSDSATGSMTTAGIACLSIVKRLLARAPAPHTLKPAEGDQLDASIRAGMAWLEHHFDVHENPRAGRVWHYYYLYGLERVGALLDLRYIGKHDWYREGVEYLLAHQTQAGNWPPRDANGRTGDSRHVNTCFALLFLTRSTHRRRRR